MAMVFAGVYLTVELNHWNQRFFDFLQKPGTNSFSNLLLQFLAMAGGVVSLNAMRIYLIQLLQIRWRAYLTETTTGRWLAVRKQVSLARLCDNPDQRVGEDVRDFARLSLDLTLGFLSEVTTLGSFAVILWNLSRIIPLPGQIPGSLIWICLVYSFFGTWLIHKVGRSLIQLDFDQQKTEGNFRHELHRLRANSPEVTRSSLKDSFEKIQDNFLKIMLTQRNINLFKESYLRIGAVFPYLLATPGLLAGAVTLGTLIQVGKAFQQFHASLSFIVKSYDQIAYWRSVVRRLHALEMELSHADPEDEMSPAKPGDERDLSEEVV